MNRLSLNIQTARVLLDRGIQVDLDRIARRAKRMGAHEIHALIKARMK